MKLRIAITQTKLLILTSLFFVIFYNWTFFSKCLVVYPFSSSRLLFFASLFTILLLFINILLNLVRSRFTTKPILYLLFFTSSLAAYVMDSFGTVIDDIMILNIISTNFQEALDLFSINLVFYVLFLWILPSFILSKVTIRYLPLKMEFYSRLKSIGISIVLITVLLFSFGKNYASFFREQKTLRYYTNPTYYIYSLGRFFSKNVVSAPGKMIVIGEDAKVLGQKKRKIVIFVVGETARRDRFSLNGYKKETNSRLKDENVISLSNMTSCGTSTAVSVPCVFSNLGRKGFSSERAESTENLLDVLGYTKNVNILWRDNNSNSKGVALRVPYEDFKMPPINTLCDSECRDVGMLVGLDDYIAKNQKGDFFIIFHQMGNHGPAYYKRYPPSFEKFKPACQTNELEKCTNDEINNAYDNAIFYTDYFLSETINFLKKNSASFDTALFYVSDHGESLGEKGVYLHSLPYFMAPDEQKNVAAVLWFGGDFANKVNYKLLKKKAMEPLSHDNVFHTFLGLFNVQTKDYKSEMDILFGAIRK